MQDTMHGIIKEFEGVGLAYKTALPIPQLEHDDEVLFKVKAAALCGTDIHIYNWDKWSQLRVKPPLTIGHEVSGDVIAVGKAVKKVKVGDRISVESHVTCGNCYFCNNNMAEICSNVAIFGVTIPGGFAEYAKVKESAVFKLDDDISYEVGCMFEPFGAGVHGVEAAEVAGKNVIISGLGPIGMVAVSAAKTLGAKTVIVTSRSDEKLEIAKDMGGDVLINSKRQDVTAEIKKITDGLGADAAIDCSGAGAVINENLKSLRAGGRLVGVGLPSELVSVDFTEDVFYREVEITGISGRKIWETWEDTAKVLKGPYLKLNHLMGHQFAMEDFEKAIEETKNGVPGKKILIP